MYIIHIPNFKFKVNPMDPLEDQFLEWNFVLPYKWQDKLGNYMINFATRKWPQFVRKTVWFPTLILAFLVSSHCRLWVFNEAWYLFEIDSEISWKMFISWNSQICQQKFWVCVLIFNNDISVVVFQSWWLKITMLKENNCILWIQLILL